MFRGARRRERVQVIGPDLLANKSWWNAGTLSANSSNELSRRGARNNAVGRERANRYGRVELDAEYFFRTGVQQSPLGAASVSRPPRNGRLAV
ncbi:unnamed protein product, partial [Iphiclides podalirius]